MIRRCLWVGIVMALGLGPAGCGSKTEASGGGAAAVKAFEGLADAICACKDIDCATKAGEAATKELDKYKNVKLDQNEEAAAKKAGERVAECMTKLTPPAPAPTPAPTPAPEPAPTPAPAPATPPG